VSTNGRVVVGCTHGEQEPDYVAVAYLTAVAALDQGKDVVMWLSVEGVRLGVRGYADGIRVGQDPSVARLHQQFTEKGGQMFVCPICFNERRLNADDLVDGAELKGATPLMEFVGDGAATFNY
jgi:predicted peroxiredoxin